MNKLEKKYLKDGDIGTALLILVYEISGVILLTVAGYVLGLATVSMIGGSEGAYSIMPDWAVRLVKHFLGVLS